ncbi:MAG: hypothetical protein E6G88_13805 [Alphaproteobacteria bacterium]|nr:MAG: hypothetical protein E6G88_13805 [Alphaproteobacteria bacterium]
MFVFDPLRNLLRRNRTIVDGKDLPRAAARCSKRQRMMTQEQRAGDQRGAARGKHFQHEPGYELEHRFFEATRTVAKLASFAAEPWCARALLRAFAGIAGTGRPAGKLARPG